MNDIAQIFQTEAGGRKGTKSPTPYRHTVDWPDFRDAVPCQGSGQPAI